MTFVAAALPRRRPAGALLCALLMLAVALLALLPASARAAALDLAGNWLRPTTSLQQSNPFPPELRGLPAVERLPATGGHFWYVARLQVSTPGHYVLDFRNSSVIGNFRHHLYGAEGLTYVTEGGIRSSADNAYFLRHGRDVELDAGEYLLVTEVDSPFFLAQPEPYLAPQAHYRASIKPGNALTLICLGVFLGLGLYYASLAVARQRAVEGMYALFILGNLLYNGSALLVFPDLFGIHWFYLISVPILFSNIAYILFVRALLEIRRDNHPHLYRLSRGLLMVLAMFIVVAAFRPSWSLELDRYGVGLFLLFGLTAGTLCAFRGNPSARLYLVANVAFFIPGITSITLLRLDGYEAFYVEHLGLLAVAIEVLMLALVLSYQFAQLQREKEEALARAEENLRVAYTDALTGLPNRYALDLAMAALPAAGSLTFVDLDGLKRYNDTFGHNRGDELIRLFAVSLAQRLGEHATLHRLGGDEFAITAPDGDFNHVETQIGATVEELRDSGFVFSGASYGSVRVLENPGKDELKHLADMRMYEHKRRRKLRDGLLDGVAETAP